MAARWIASILISLVIAQIGLHVWRKVFSRRGIPKGVPWLYGDSIISRGKATIKSFVQSRNMLAEGYEKFSKRGELFVLPNLLIGPEIMLPPGQIRWLINQPDHIMSPHEVNVQTISADKTMLDPVIIRGLIHRGILQKELSREQDGYTVNLNDEIDHCHKVMLGNNKDWKEINPFVLYNDIIPRTLGRVLVGPELCRNEEYLKSAHSFAKLVPLVALVDHLTLPILNPLVMPLATAYDNYHARKIREIICPVVRERVKNLEKGKEFKGDDNDFIQWSLRYADDDVERSPEMISKRLTVLSFAATHSTVLMITNILYDIASSRESLAIQRSLREEIIVTMSRNAGNEWSKASLAEMIRLDSAIQESLRLWGFSTRGVSKQVVAPGGVKLPSGLHVPCGTIVGITNWAVHHDEAFYRDAGNYNPFRFSDPGNALEVNRLYGSTEKSWKTTRSMISTGDYYLAFSHGRHSCPGRFFAQHHIKSQIAKLLLRYDIEPLSKRPENPWFNNLVACPMESTLRVRRRS